MKPAGLISTLLAIGAVLSTAEGHGGRIEARDTPPDPLMRRKTHRFLTKRDDSNLTNSDPPSNLTTGDTPHNISSGDHHHHHHSEDHDHHDEDHDHHDEDHDHHDGGESDEKNLLEKIAKDRKEVHEAERKLKRAKGKLDADKKKLRELKENHSSPHLGIGSGNPNNGTGSQTQSGGGEGGNGGGGGTEGENGGSGGGGGGGGGRPGNLTDLGPNNHTETNTPARNGTNSETV